MRNLRLSISLQNVGKIDKKNSVKECVFVNSALKIQCHVVNNTLLQTAFSAILPTGIVQFFIKFVSQEKGVLIFANERNVVSSQI